MFYYQVVEGSVRMANMNDDGKEFIQGIFKQGESFGEPVLFIDMPYPATAIANEPLCCYKSVERKFSLHTKGIPGCTPDHYKNPGNKNLQ